MNAFDHLTLVLAGVLAIVVGLLDAHTGGVLGSGVDEALVLGGFASLGLKIGVSAYQSRSSDSSSGGAAS